MSAAAIYLGHLNPMTKAHESIISMLQQDYHVYVFPVRFIRGDREINTKSFPFPYELRKQMVDSVFGDSVTVLPNYAFHAPFVKYELYRQAIGEKSDNKGWQINIPEPVFDIIKKNWHILDEFARMQDRSV